jgi:AcrR family transcriptional regulator
MSESHSLPDLILDHAGELFRSQGYAATTIKQIARAAGCTTAALYYHFEDGKQHILREVIRASAQEAELSMHLPQANSLEAFLIGLSASLEERWPHVADRFNWLMLQFPTLPDAEKRTVQNQIRAIQRGLCAQISRYVPGQDAAEHLAWLVYCSFFGYQQMFTKMELGQVVDLPMEGFGRFLAQIVSQGLHDEQAQAHGLERKLP